MGVKATAASASAAWKTGFAGAGQKYTDGINSVTVAPGQLAAAQKNAYVQGVQQNADIWARKVAAVDVNAWKQAAITTGVARLNSGADKGASKYQTFAGNFLPVLSSIVGSLPARGSFDQNMARSMNYARQLHDKKGNF